MEKEEPIKLTDYQLNTLAAYIVGIIKANNWRIPKTGKEVLPHEGSEE